MEIKDFVEKFTELFDDTDASEITPTTEFRELEEWGSLISMSLIALFKTEFNKTISGKDIRGCKTVEDLYNIAIG